VSRHGLLTFYLFAQMLFSAFRTKRRWFPSSVACRSYSGHHEEDHHGDHNSTGWPQPTGREPLKPFDRNQVAAYLSAKPGQENIDGVELEGWLFGKKVYYLNTERPYYEQIPENQAYLFGEKV
jgi:hypothetical protein